MPRMVAEEIVIRVYKLVKDNADDKSTWLTDEESEIMDDLIDQFDEVSGGVVELVSSKPIDVSDVD